MTLTYATLIPAILLILFGAALVSKSSIVVSSLKALPRSRPAAAVLFTLGAAWFLYEVGQLPPADFGDYRRILVVAFGILAVLAFFCIPDFLAVRGLCILMLMAASPLLRAGYMNFEQPLVFLYKIPVFVGIVVAIWFGAQPWRLRDFFSWLFHPGGRSRAVGLLSLAYGLVLAGVAFTY